MSKRAEFPSARSLSICSARLQVLAALFSLRRADRHRRRITFQARILAVAARYGIGVRTVNSWLGFLKHGGVAGLLRRERSDAGIPRKLTHQALEFIGAQLKRRPRISIAESFRSYEAKRNLRPSLPVVSFETFRYWAEQMREASVWGIAWPKSAPGKKPDLVAKAASR